MMWLDLDELHLVFAGRWLWSTKQFALARFCESVHLVASNKSISLRDQVLAVLQEAEINTEVGPIRLLTQFRYLGFAMNPVSFFYCYDQTDRAVIAIIAEVNNTPWGEQHLYVMPGNQNRQTIAIDRIKKEFHVSPFMSLDLQYRMMFTHPESQLGVKIENFDGENRIFDVSMLLRRKPLSTWNLNRMLLTYPLISLKVFVGIYWQAARLYLKRIPVHAHPKHRSEVSSKQSDSKSNSVLVNL